MFQFNSPAITKNIWTLCFRDKEEMTRLFYENRTPDEGVRYFGITDYVHQIIYIDKELDGFLLGKTLRHELAHVYLWETGQQDRVFNEEEICELMSVAGPVISETADNIMLRLKEGWYKHGE